MASLCAGAQAKSSGREDLAVRAGVQNNTGEAGGFGWGLLAWRVRA